MCVYRHEHISVVLEEVTTQINEFSKKNAAAKMRQLSPDQISIKDMANGDWPITTSPCPSSFIFTLLLCLIHCLALPSSSLFKLLFLPHFCFFCVVDRLLRVSQP